MNLDRATTNVLVTGAGGFIGAILSQQISLEEGLARTYSWIEGKVRQSLDR